MSRTNCDICSKKGYYYCKCILRRATQYAIKSYEYSHGIKLSSILKDKKCPTCGKEFDKCPTCGK